MRWLLLVHAVTGGALVAAATHLVVWTWGAARGRATRWRGVRILATTSLALYAAVFLAGNLLYPTYKQQVRIEYLDDTTAVRDEVRARLEAADRAAARRAGLVGEDAPRTAMPAEVPQLQRVSHIFDIKEHWVALGLAFAAGACALAWAWDPRRGPRADEAPWPGRLLFATATATAACAWLGLLVGLWVTSYRSVGALP